MRLGLYRRTNHKFLYGISLIRGDSMDSGHGLMRFPPIPSKAADVPIQGIFQAGVTFTIPSVWTSRFEMLLHEGVVAVLGCVRDVLESDAPDPFAVLPGSDGYNCASICFRLPQVLRDVFRRPPHTSCILLRCAPCLTFAPPNLGNIDLEKATPKMDCNPRHRSSGL